MKMFQLHMYFTSQMTRNFCEEAHENSLGQNVTFLFIKLKPCLRVMFLLTWITKKSRALISGQVLIFYSGKLQMILLAMARSLPRKD